jgi:hypothetical protein
VNPLRLQSLALAASLMHVIVDFQVGLYGTGTIVSGLQAANIVAYAAMYALWGWALGAAAGSRGAVASLVILAGGWAAMGQGLIGFVACPPPCGGATGIQDAAHFLSLVVGAWAAYATARVFGESPGPIGWWPSVIAVALIAGGFALEGLVFAATR